MVDHFSKATNYMDVQVGLELEFTNETTKKWKELGKIGTGDLGEMKAILDRFIGFEEKDKNTAVEIFYKDAKTLGALVGKRQPLIEISHKDLRIHITVDIQTIEVIVLKGAFSKLYLYEDFIKKIYERLWKPTNIDMVHINIDWDTGFGGVVKNLVDQIITIDKKSALADPDKEMFVRVNAPLIKELVTGEDYDKLLHGLKEADGLDGVRDLMLMKEPWGVFLKEIKGKLPDDFIETMRKDALHYRAVNIQHIWDPKKDLQRVEFRRFMHIDFDNVLKQAQALVDNICYWESS